jgi:predicted dinucleotide-binding enzyme
VDCTNAVGADFRPAAHPSGAELVAGWAPGALVIKAFNSTGFNVMANPQFGQQAATAFLCGDDAAAKQTVARLAQELGMEPLDCGPLARANLLESLALLWIALARQGLGREIAFTLLRR